MLSYTHQHCTSSTTMYQVLLSNSTHKGIVALAKYLIQIAMAHSRNPAEGGMNHSQGLVVCTRRQTIIRHAFTMYSTSKKGSFTATTSNSSALPMVRAARSTRRPIRPNLENASHQVIIYAISLVANCYLTH